MNYNHKFKYLKESIIQSILYVSDDLLKGITEVYFLFTLSRTVVTRSGCTFKLSARAWRLSVS